jgi:hypothetical protein
MWRDARRVVVLGAVGLLLLGLGPIVGRGASAGEPFASVPAVPAPPMGEDAFYAPPAPVPDGRPGDLIRHRDVATTFYSAHVTQIMYLSTGNQGERTVVTGLLLTPSSQKPGNANPLVVHTPGTRGLGDHCAPSRQANLKQANPASGDYAGPEYSQLLDKGISVVVTDYAGQGTPGDSAYLMGRPEGYNGLDALRAAERLEGRHHRALQPGRHAVPGVVCLGCRRIVRSDSRRRAHLWHLAWPAERDQMDG